MEPGIDYFMWNRSCILSIISNITNKQKNFDNLLAKQVFKMKQKANRGDKH